MKTEEMIKEMRASQTDTSAKWEDVFNMSYVPVYLNFDWGLNSDGTIPCLRYVAPYIWHTAHYSLEKRIAEGTWIPYSLNAEDIFHGKWEKVNMYDLDPSNSNETYQRWRQEEDIKKKARDKALSGNSTVSAKPKNPYAPPIGYVRKGSTGSGVKWVQWALAHAGYRISVDGLFGSGTYNAVIDFQKKHGLSADGIVCPSTKKALATI